MNLPEVSWGPIERAVIQTGHQFARERGVFFTDVFDDTLQGELARMQVKRRLRRRGTEVSVARLEIAVEETLTP
jgi:hypothetical protein